VTEGRLFGTLGRSCRESLSVWDGSTIVNTFAGAGSARIIVVRSSLVTAYLAAVATTVWAISAELDRSPRADLTLAIAPAEAKPPVPDHEWRAWARQYAGLQKRVEALVRAPPTRLADAAPLPAPTPRPTITAKTAWSPPPKPALKPVQWSDERRLLLAANATDEAAPPSSTESFWSRVLTLFEPASASTMAASGDSGLRNASAADRRAGQQAAAPQSSGQAGSSAGDGAAGAADANARSDRSTGGGGRSGSDRNSSDDQSAGSDRSGFADRGVAGDRSARGDRGFGDRGFGGRSEAGDRGRDRDDRGDRGDRDGRGDRSGRPGRSWRSRRPGPRTRLNAASCTRHSRAW
jgi:hypothetical protein